MVRPHIEFANSVWCPYKLGDIKEIERVHKRATKLIIKVKNKPYRDRLFYLNLPTLKYRRLRGDMKTTTKKMSERKRSSLCTVNIWNSRPNSIVNLI